MEKSRRFISLAIAFIIFLVASFVPNVEAQEDKLIDIDSLTQENFGVFFIDYLDNIVKEIATDSSIYDLVSFSIGMVIYGIFVYHFYRFLSKRDMFSVNIEQRLAYGK